MWSLFGQVWVLCLVSFLVGAVVTWAVFGTRRRPTRPSGVDDEGWLPPTSWAGADHADPAPAPVPAPPIATPSGPPADPALAALDSYGRVRPGAAATALGELDRLGVTGRAAAAPAPYLPGPDDGVERPQPTNR